MNVKLTGNDLALAESAAQLAIAWWKEQPRSGFKTKQVAAYKALIGKLSAINQYAYPYEVSDDMPIDFGSEALMVLDQKAVKATRAAARQRAA